LSAGCRWKTVVYNVYHPSLIKLSIIDTIIDTLKPVSYCRIVLEKEVTCQSKVKRLSFFLGTFYICICVVSTGFMNVLINWVRDCIVVL